MSLGAMIVGLVLFGLAIPFVLNPLTRKNGRRVFNNPTRNVTEVADRYTETLTALRDLDFDKQTGKITPEDYVGLRSELLVRAAQELNAKKQQELELDSKLENAILERKKKINSTKTCKKCGEKLKATDLFCSACGEPSNPVCQNCGHEIQPGDLYCYGCGQSTKSVRISKTENVS